MSVLGARRGSRALGRWTGEGWQASSTSKGALAAPLDCPSSPQAHGQTFTFPDLFPEKKLSPEGDSVDKDVQQELLEEQRKRQSQDPRRGGVPAWFGL